MCILTTRRDGIGFVRIIGVFCCIGLLMPGCKTPSSGQGSQVGSTEDAAQIARGYDTLVNSNYVGCGVPLEVMKRAVQATSIIPAAIAGAFFPLAAEKVFKPSIIPGRNQDNAGIVPSFNVFVTSRGVKAVNFSCLSCHGEVIDGRYIIGLGNRSRDFTQDVRAFTNLLPLMVRSDKERQELAVFQKSMNAIAPYMQTKTVGVNPAINLTYALFAFRSPDDLKWQDSQIMDPPNRDFPPVRVPAWWLLRDKNVMFYSAEFSKHHNRIMTLAAGLCMDDGDAIKALDAPFRDVEAYIRALPSPKFPLPTNPDLVHAGQAVYGRACAGCHGAANPDGTIDYVKTIIPIGDIGTDRWLMVQQTGAAHQRFRAWGEKAFLNMYHEGMSVELHQGYIAPPLTGVWATAPYFHNGSVPSLEAVLNSKIRPKYWRKLGVVEGTDYDTQHAAVKYSQESYGQAQTLPLLKRYVYDTTLDGYGNQGHTYGDQLSDQDRQAVMEFVKTL